MGRNSYHGCGTIIDPRRDHRRQRRREERGAARKAAKELAKSGNSAQKAQSGSERGAPGGSTNNSPAVGKRRNRSFWARARDQAEADRILEQKVVLQEKRALAIVRDNPKLLKKLAQLKVTAPEAYQREIGKILAGKRR